MHNFSPNHLIGIVTLLLFLGLVSFARCALSEGAIRADLTSLNAICRGLDSCRDNRTSDSLVHYNCHCGSYCRDLDTCCLDSPYRPIRRQIPRFVAKCHGVYGRPGLNVFSVNECRRGWRDEDDGILVREMCDSNGEDRNDPFLSVPVTSLRSAATYKNYYCAVCNENPSEQQVAFWNVGIRSTSRNVSIPTDRELRHDSLRDAWTIESDDGLPIPVKLAMRIPENVLRLIRTCRSPGVISECSADWTDPSTAEKCSAYTALVSTSTGGRSLYRNPHCALCNKEEAYALECEESGSSVLGSSDMRRTFFVGLFMLEEEGRRRKCERDMVYDGLAKKCRVVRCPRNHTVKNQRCVRNGS